jgi:hypothetical protein
LRVPRAWNLDGRSLSKVRVPFEGARLRGHVLQVRVRLLGSPRGAGRLRFRLPAGLHVSGSHLRVNGRSVVTVSKGRTIVAKPVRGRVRSIALDANVKGRSSGSVKVSLRGQGSVALPLR